MMAELMLISPFYASFAIFMPLTLIVSLSLMSFSITPFTAIVYAIYCRHYLY